MRPIRLSIEGLRSFHAEPATVIEFGIREQLAIVGDTGAGKSSVLEAMTWALYGQVSYSAHANQELINDQASFMRVVFAFWAGDYQWVATRMCDRRGDGSVRPAAATLEKLDDQDQRIELYEGVKQANAAARELLGLDVNAFLRTIVLPQGRFARLLTDDDPRSRANILSQIWRTDDLERGAADVATRCSDLRTLLVRVNAVLEGEPEDAEAHAAGLHEEAATSKSRAAHARGIETRGVEILKDAGSRNELRRLAEGALNELAEIDTADIREEAARIAGDRKAAAASLRTAETAAAGAQKTLERIETAQAGIDPAKTAADLDDVRNLERCRRQAAGTTSAVTETRAAATAAEATAVESESKARAASETLRKRGVRAETARTGAAETRQRVREAATAIETYRQGACREAGAAARRLETAARTRARLETETNEQQRRASAARKQDAEVRAEADTLAARHAAHQAAAGHAPGDPCPVCDRVLDPDWEPPAADGLEATRRRAAEADETARREATRLERLNGRLESARREESAAEQEAAQARSRRQQAAARCAEVAGIEPGEVESGWERRRERLHAEATRAGTAETAAREALAQAEGEAAAAQRAAAERRATATAGRREAQGAEQRLASEMETAKRLEDRCGAAGWDPRTPLEERATTLQARVETERRMFAERAEAALAVAAAKDSVLAAERRAAAVEQRSREHDEASAGAWRTLDAITQRVRLPAARSETGERKALETALGQVRRQAEVAAAEAAIHARRARNNLLDLLELNGIDAPADDADAVRRALRERTEERSVRLRAAEQAVAAFDTRAPAIEALQATAAQAETRLGQLLEIAAALKPGGFPKWLTLRRSTDLLRHASVRLEEMSRGQYAFRDPRDTEEVWKVLDRRTGATRSPATLSGGEQFIGALALSLGMVETMGARGGRLESFFLDEGFGTLDRRSLDMALEGLERAATPEHLVGVITHVREVAERIGHVLHIERSPSGGSRARWLTDEERAALAEGSSLGNLGLTSTA